MCLELRLLLQALITVTVSGVLLFNVINNAINLLLLML